MFGDDDAGEGAAGHMNSPRDSDSDTEDLTASPVEDEDEDG